MCFFSCCLPGCFSLLCRCSSLLWLRTKVQGWLGTRVQLGPCWVENSPHVKQDTVRPATPSLVATPKWEACLCFLALCFCRFGSYLLFMMTNSTLFWQKLATCWSSTWKERVFSPHWQLKSYLCSLKASPNLRTQLWVDCWADREGGPMLRESEPNHTDALIETDDIWNDERPC